jgi:hypothetical protein
VKLKEVDFMFDDILDVEESFYSLLMHINEGDSDNADLLLGYIEDVENALGDVEDYDNRLQVLQHILGQGVKRLRENDII